MNEDKKDYYVDGWRNGYLDKFMGAEKSNIGSTYPDYGLKNYAVGYRDGYRNYIKQEYKEEIKERMSF